VDPAILRAATTDNPCTAGEVALTFDDGPDLYTRPILDVLHAYGAKSTFFVLGSKAVTRPDLVKAEAADGHLVENHSWDHPHLVDLSLGQIQAEIAETQRAIVAAGAPAPTMLRPPFGSTDATVDGEATAQHLRVVRWTLDTNDWRGRAPADITAAILNNLAPGVVILLHDGTRESINTARALPDIITGLRARGYCTAPMR
jgi:peptidoglycan/xylan/chitin deacetylase (PgdA/CDA1 family)